MAPLVMRFSDDILAEIFIRLPTLEDLGRACASCPAFRSVITSRSFLRRLHALQPPSLLGFHSLYWRFYPAEPPHPSAPAARAVAEAAGFNFLFLPTTKRGFWTVSDGRFDPVVTVVVDPGVAAFVGAARVVAQGLVQGGIGDGQGPGGGAVTVDSRGAALWASIVGPSPWHGASAAAAQARADGVRDNGEGGERRRGAARFRETFEVEGGDDRG